VANQSIYDVLRQDHQTVLREMIRHHVHEEEENLFPKAHQLFDEDMEQQLARRFEDQKRIEQHHI
jgi:hemerythrin-like domain-containing protein